jgi:hypothetical protein
MQRNVVKNKKAVESGKEELVSSKKVQQALPQ